MDKLRVLLIEDNLDDAATIVSQVQKAFAPGTVEYKRVDREDDLVKALANPWDVILCDYLVPYLPWPTALRHAQNRMCNVPFIVASGLIGEDDAGLSAIRDGAWDAISKTHLNRLGHVIRREMARAEALASHYAVRQLFVKSIEKISK